MGVHCRSNWWGAEPLDRECDGGGPSGWEECMLNNGVEGSPVDRPTESNARPGLVPMLQHADVWRGIDRLAAKHGLSASGLARRAGLDPTAFNPSKRITREGRPRW